MNHQLFKKLAVLFTLFLLSTLVARAQVPAPPQPLQPAGLEVRKSDGGDLIESIKRGELAEVAKILFGGTSADEADKEGGRPLCWAVRLNRRDMVELLLANGADANQAEDDGGTALDVAAAAGHAEMVKLLLSRGAVVNHKDHCGHTALIVSAMGAVFGEIPPFILNAMMGEEPTEKVEQMRANIGTEHQTVMELLLKAGADPNTQADDCGMTALIVAAMGGNVGLVQMLIKHGANVNLKSGDKDALGFAGSFESSEGMADLWETEDEETKQALLIWSQTTKPGRQQVTKMLRAAGAQD